MLQDVEEYGRALVVWRQATAVEGEGVSAAGLRGVQLEEPLPQVLLGQVPRAPHDDHRHVACLLGLLPLGEDASLGRADGL